MKTVTQSALFQAAHQTAKATIQAGDNYQVTFAAALKMGYAYMAKNNIAVVRKTEATKPSQIAEIRALEMVEFASEWKDRIYINVKGNGGSYRGEASAKVFLLNGQLNAQLGKGSTSREFDANLEALKAVFA